MDAVGAVPSVTSARDLGPLERWRSVATLGSVHLWRFPSSPAIGAMALVVALVTGAVGCGDDTPTRSLSPEAERGREIALTNGCVACHGHDGEGPIAPAWRGLYESTVTLDDGTTVIADDAYLRRSVLEPDAQRVAGYALQMPAYDLDDEELDALIAYIRELS